MSAKDILIQLTGVFRQLFDNDKIALSLKTTAADMEGWDSLMHINLIVAVESKFGIKFKSAETEKLKNVGDFVQLIEKKSARP